ncbi:MAG TPA: glycosyl hydrolase family 28-related protein [Allosphingosinicella sp.]|jgi:hypothetical protein
MTIDSNDVTFTQSGTGAVTRTVRSKLRDTVSVKDFGAAGDGVTNDSAAIAAAYASGAGAVYFPKGTYLTAAEIDTAGVKTFGDGLAQSKVKATAAMRSVFKLTGQHNSLVDLFVEANALASHGLYCTSCNGSTIDRIAVENAVLDAIHFPTSGNNSATTVRQSLIRGFGSQYATGTASAATGSNTATISGAANLTTLGIRPRLDYIKLAGDIARAIVSVTSNSVTVNGAATFPATFSGVTYKILRGNGVAIDANGDNSQIKVEKCEIQSGKGAGVRDCALYSAQCTGNIYEALEYGYHVGNADNVSAAIGSREVGGYFELMGSRAIYVEQSTGGYFAPTQLEGGRGGIYVTDHVRANGVTIDYSGHRFSGQHVTFVNHTSADVGWGGEFDFLQSSAASNIVVNLPPVTAGSTEQRVLDSLGGGQIVLTFIDIGGKTATIKTTDGTPVNGVAGTTGYAHIGNYRILRCRYSASSGWIVN